MKLKFAGKASAALLLPLVLLIGCGDDKAPARVDERPKAERLFDTQRSALEEAKEAAGTAGQRSQEFQQRAKDID